jgi:hypothetical protein
MTTTYRQRAARGAAVTRALKAAGFVITPIFRFEGIHVSASSATRVRVSCDLVGKATRTTFASEAAKALREAGYGTTLVEDDDGIASFYATKMR